MSDMQKIVILCIAGLVLIGFFLYSLSMAREDERTQLETNEQTEMATSSTTDTIDTETSAEASTEATTSTDRPDRSEDLPPSSDAGMEFPTLE